MFRLKSRLTVTQPSQNRLVIQLSGRRRILFGIIAAILLLAFAVSVDFEQDFGSGLSAGSVVYFLLVLICLAVAGWNSLVILDRGSSEVRFSKRLYGLEVQEISFSFSDVHSVVLQSVQFLKRQEMPHPGAIANRFRQVMERRNVYYKLYLEAGEKRHFVEDSTDTSELDEAARAMSQYLSIPLQREEL